MEVILTYLTYALLLAAASAQVEVAFTLDSAKLSGTVTFHDSRFPVARAIYLVGLPSGRVPSERKSHTVYLMAGICTLDRLPDDVGKCRVSLLCMYVIRRTSIVCLNVSMILTVLLSVTVLPLLLLPFIILTLLYIA